MERSKGQIFRKKDTECRRLFAGLIGARVEDIALIPKASAVAGQLAAHLASRFPGGMILVGESEYTSKRKPAKRKVAPRSFC